MQHGRNLAWQPAHKLDHSPDVPEATIELPNSLLIGSLRKRRVVAVRCRSQERPVLQLRLVGRPHLAAVVSDVDYARLGAPTPNPEIELRPLTGAEVMRRFAGRAALPAFALVAAVGATVAAAGPSTANTTGPIAAGAAVPAAAVALWAAVKNG
jgi:hypothetical protein